MHLLHHTSRELQCRSLGQKLKERDYTINDLNQQIQTSTSTCKTLQEGLTQVCAHHCVCVSVCDF